MHDLITDGNTVLLVEEIKMGRNTLRIVCNPYTKQISYYFKNEVGEWNVLSGSSPLSRQFYTKTSMKERSREILDKVDEIYNRKNKGLDILFEGTSNSFEYLAGTIKHYFPDRDIKCELGTTKIAVVGKKAVGKSCLIEGLQEHQGYSYSKTNRQGCVQYADECNHAQWYEVDGIDLGRNNIEKAFHTLEKLSEEGLSAVIYCISAISGRMEEIEKDFVMKLVNDFSELKVMVVLNMCYRDDIQEIVDEIEKMTDQIKTVQTLAKEYKTGIRDTKSGEMLVVEPFGLEQVSKYVFEGR